MEFARSTLVDVRLRAALFFARSSTGPRVALARPKRGSSTRSPFALVFVTLLGIVHSQASSHDEPAVICESFHAWLGDGYWCVARIALCGLLSSFYGWHALAAFAPSPLTCRHPRVFD